MHQGSAPFIPSFFCCSCLIRERRGEKCHSGLLLTARKYSGRSFFLITDSYQSLPLISSSSCWVVVVSSPMIGDSFRCWRTLATTLYMTSMVAVGIDISTKTTIYAHTNNKAKGLKVEIASINNTIPRYYT